MGFWQTGYYEFHEPIGLGVILPPLIPIKYICKICQDEFDSLDKLRAHRFNRHPFRRPALIIRGREVGSTPLRITEALEAADIESSSELETLRLNGVNVPTIVEAREILSEKRNEVVIIELSSQGIPANYKLVFDIASGSDLAGVDACFVEMVRGRQLDRKSIAAFIDKSARNTTAHTYCDGICEYLYGILAKEGTDDFLLPYEIYREKFSRAADILKDYNQPLGRMIGAIVAFHFNQFREAHQLGGLSRIGSVCQIFQEWIEGKSIKQPSEIPNAAILSFDDMLTDWDTEQVIRVCANELEAVGHHLREVKSILDKDISEVDRAKLWILASEICWVQNDYNSSAEYARNLLNNPSFGDWAERSIERAQRKK